MIEARQVYMSRLLNLGDQVNLSRLLNLGEQVSSFSLAGRISTRRLIKIPLLYIMKFIQVVKLRIWTVCVFLIVNFPVVNNYFRF